MLKEKDNKVNENIKVKLVSQNLAEDNIINVTNNDKTITPQNINEEPQYNNKLDIYTEYNHEHSLSEENSDDFYIHDHEHHHHHHKGDLKYEVLPFLMGLLIFADAILISQLYDAKYLIITLYITSYLILGYNVIKSTLLGLKNKNFFDENFLMTLATIGSFALGEYSEAVGVVLFFRIGELFEEYAVSQSRKAITEVSKLKVDEADVFVNGQFKRIHSDKIKVGDILLIKVGERLAVDGIIESGESKMDTSAVNGEPIQLSVKKGDKVFSGFINLSETFTLRATATASDSMISKIANAVKDASSSKPRINRFITRFAHFYTPVVISIALLTAIVPSFLTGNWNKWIYSGLTFLVISCPCALVLSIPLAYFSGIGVASKLGILFKGGNVIEILGKVKVIVFDKTGTLTNGNFTITEIKSYGSMTEKELLFICGSCEQNSTHPIAESITDHCKRKNVKFCNPEKLKEISGRGISAIIDNKNILCGNEKLLNDNNIPIIDKNIPIGCLVYIAIDNKLEGRIIVSDSIKKTSSMAVAQLKNIGVKTAIFTGDKTENALTIANHLGIDLAKGDLLPKGKLSELDNLRKENGIVMFVGDGFNDGPVLAGADVGGAMYNGSDLALTVADIVFMNSEPEAIVKAKLVADKTILISYENIILTLAIKGIILLFGLLGYPNMWLAVFADSGTSLLLILNSIRVMNNNNYK